MSYDQDVALMLRKYADIIDEQPLSKFRRLDVLVSETHNGFGGHSGLTIIVEAPHAIASSMMSATIEANKKRNE